VIGILFKVQVKQEEDVQVLDEQMQAPREMHYEHAVAPSLDEYEGSLLAEQETETTEQSFVQEGHKVGRNDPCPCGSGKKYKQCHGKLS